MSPTTTERVGEGERVAGGDIEGKLRELRGEVGAVGEASRNYVVIAAAVGAVAVIGMAYFMGRRKGKKKTTVVEVRRV